MRPVLDCPWPKSPRSDTKEKENRNQRWYFLRAAQYFSPSYALYAYTRHIPRAHQVVHAGAVIPFPKPDIAGRRSNNVSSYVYREPTGGDERGTSSVNVYTANRKTGTGGLKHRTSEMGNSVSSTPDRRLLWFVRCTSYPRGCLFAGLYYAASLYPRAFPPPCVWHFRVSGNTKYRLRDACTHRRGCVG